jgi:hypothetical protein
MTACVTTGNPVLQRISARQPASPRRTGSQSPVLQPPWAGSNSSYHAHPPKHSRYYAPKGQRADARTRGRGWSA